MAKIKNIVAREILDSRGNPTIEAEVFLDNGISAVASVPSGASTGSHEALELRDGGDRYDGKGVTKAVKKVNKKIFPLLKGLAVDNQKEIDRRLLELDGTENKSKLGANSILSVSLAAARAAAKSKRQPLYYYLRKKYWPKEKKWRFPIPMMNIINGGAHAGWSVDVQEFMIVPRNNNVEEAIRAGAEVFHSLKKVLSQLGYPTTVGDEGGYAPKLKGNEQALKLILRAIADAGYRPGCNISIALDVAASEFFDGKKYDMKADKKKRNAAAMIKMLAGWIKKYPIESIEDGLAEDDWSGWQLLTNELSNKVSLIGDDLFVTNQTRLRQGIKSKVANGILIKLNQIGSLTETAECIKLAQKNGYKVAVSHRSGETSDDFISDLAVAASADYLKAGSLSRGERVAKYNRLAKIYREVKNK